MFTCCTMAHAAARALGIFLPAGVHEFDDLLELLALPILHGEMTQEEALTERDELNLRIQAWMADQMTDEVDGGYYALAA